ncbi:ABC transporter substrate-binding protein [Castellaniella defragrans]|uniref:Branched-chain amino acid transport system substrate-binding protein n=1 Tax=Castellaniella defragrans TaxID=75697 RepID=A0A7W9WMX5_CASDE|nr:ABC transporter substrate-binding protein [Castellaniella defragrans]KAB0609127.1 ABC transporter substrate-binding protein [Castellaniella defragrans]MBB6083256.1 branched-chain amino acid transport system substrate-binding protein [Castellaniella defragrans]
MRKLLIGAALAAALGTSAAPAAAAVKVGLMLPYSGTYAALGEAIENGFRLYLQEQGGTLAGQDIEFFKVDDESDPSKASENANRLIRRDQVDVLVGTVHSGVALALAKAAKESDTTLIIPNAGADALTGSLCSEQVFRTSFTNWQPGFAMGAVAAGKGYKKAVTITWNYAAGKEATDGFKDGFERKGGKVVKHLSLPFPKVEFQPLLTEIAALEPDAVFTFFAGGGAVKFVQDYAASGLGKTIPLLGSGFLTDGTLKAQGEAAQGLLTTLHYADGLDTPRDNAFRAHYAQAYGGAQPDVYAVQGYDAAQLLAAGLAAAQGDAGRKDVLRQAMRDATIDSPRGAFKLSKAGNPVQDIYLREVRGDRNQVVGVASKALADPARGCRL